MNADALIRRLAALDIAMSVNGDSLELRPASRLPAELHDAIRLHKAALLDRLAQHTPTDTELADIAHRVIDNGYCLLYASVLADFVAFVRGDTERKNVPPGFTIYDLDELVSLFGGQGLHTTDSLLLIHQAKKLGGRIINE